MSKKRKYHVTAQVTISISTEVEASSKKEAIALAEEQPLGDILDGEPMGCHADTHWLTSGELDGVPSNLRAEREAT